jgi:probable phosphoglycerate mutase
VAAGRHYRLDTATISVLTYERETPVIARWNT